MKASQLRNAVLQLAIQGKLVAQNKNDEPASVLLERIKDEKEQLIKEGKVKKEKPLPAISEEEKPFEIPEGWEWTRLGDIGNWGAGATPIRSKSEYYNGTIPWLKTGELNDGYISSSEEKITELALKETSVKLNQPGVVLMAMYGATIGKLGILQIEATTNQACCACKLLNGVDNKYLFFYLLSQREQLKKKSEGGAQPNISREKIIFYHFPLPPLAEQKRIVAKIEEIMPLINQYEKLEQELSTLEKEFPDKLRKSILQYAVQGKLVEQDQKDEPASQLLQKIAEEKERLIKEGKIKKEKPLPPISEEEKPYELPQGWEWVRLGEVGEVQTGTTPPTSNPEYFNGEYPFIKPADISPNGINYGNESLTNEGISKGRLIRENSVMMVCIGGSIGKSYFIDRECSCNQQINAITGFCEVSAKFMNYFLSSPYFFREVISRATGSATPIINKSNWESILFPLPPLNEQKRIVEKVDKLMGMCEQLEKSIE